LKVGRNSKIFKMYPQMKGVGGDTLSLVGFPSCSISIPFGFDQKSLDFPHKNRNMSK